MKTTRRVVRYILPDNNNSTQLQDGEEYTIDYIESRMLPTHMRQKKLQNTKSFTCNCDRCTNPIDTTRCIPCCNRDKNCDGVHYVTSSPSVVGLNNCTICNDPCDNTITIEELQEQEDYIQNECLELNALYDSEEANHPDMQRRLLQLQPPHKYHYLASDPIFIVQANYYGSNDNNNDKEKQIELLQNRVNCYEQILGDGEDVYPNVLTAVAYEMLADATSSSASAGDDTATTTTTTALRIYQKALRIYEITHGFNDKKHFSSCMDKVFQLQREQKLRNSADDSSSSSLSSLTNCALCNTPATKKCSRCNQVVYCTKQHQRAHWLPVHKHDCCK